MAKTYREAMTTPEKGLKVIVAEGECQLERQRRDCDRKCRKSGLQMREGERTVRVKYGVDEDTVHRRPLLHPALGLPGAHGQGQPGSAAPRPGRDRDRRLRGLRAVRRERARRGALPLVLPRGSRPESFPLGQAPAKAMNLPDRPITILIAALGGEGRRDGRLADGSGDRSRLAGAGDLDPRRRAAHRRDHLLPGDLSGREERPERQGAGALAHAEPQATSTSWSPPSSSRPGARC